MEVQHFLEEEYGMPSNYATIAVGKFLEDFRSQPENPSASLEEWRRFLWARALPPQYQDAAVEVADLWTEWRYEFLQPDEGVRSMLQILKSRYLLALITNGYARSQWEKINRLNMQHYFQTVLVSGELCWEKPSKAIFMMACDQLNVPPEECIMVGDRLETDIAGAHNAGFCASVWVPLEETRVNVDVSADFVIDHVTHLPRLLPPARPNLGRYLNLSEPESENSNSCDMS